MSTSTDSRKSNYFDLFTTGIGYLNQVREITPEEGLPYLVVRIAALRGHTEDIGKTYFDCRVSGRNAHEYVRFLIPDIERGGKVLIRFRMSDLKGEIFTYNKGSRQGEFGVSLRTRLIGIEWARVDGMVVKPERIAA